MNQDILICGVGGQGTVLASKLIASAAMNLGNVVHSAETIGMAQRGGSVTSHIRIGNTASSPLIPMGSADLILAFEPSEAVRNLAYLKEDGTIIVNRVPVAPSTASAENLSYDGTEMIDYLHKKCHCVVVDGEELCRPFGSSKFFNIAILGVAVGCKKIEIGADVIINEIEKRIPERFIFLNKDAFHAGIRMGETYEVK